MIQTDGFDRLPDPLILLIFNSVSDIKTLIRCRAVSKRFNSLVPQTESLLLTVDCVISPDSHSDSPFFAFLKFLHHSLHHLFNPDPDPDRTRPKPLTSPARILSRFHRIRTLQIQLPAGDLKLERGVVIKWRAEFGKSLRSCVILGFRLVCGDGDAVALDTDFRGGLKRRVVWTISALIAASARHYLLNDVVRQHEEMEKLVLEDKEGEGTVVMGREGLSECRIEAGEAREGDWEGNRTVVPSVRMRMRHAPKMQLKDGAWVEDAMLVVVRPGCYEGGDDLEDGELALGAFGEGSYGETVRVMLKGKSYLLEMNSF